MSNTWRICHNDGRAVISFGFLECLEQLITVGAHGDRRDIDIAVAHAHESEVFLGQAHAGVGELRHRADRGGLGSLAAGVGIYFGVQHQDIDVAVLRHDMIEAAETDVIRPAVAADDPDALVHKVVFKLFNLGQDFFGFAGSGFNRFGQESRRRFLRGNGFGVFLVPEFQRFAESILQAVSSAGFQNALNAGFQLSAILINGQSHAVTVFGIVFKEGVSPGGAAAFFGLGVGDGRERTAVDRGAAGGVGDDHAVAEQLRDQLHIRGFAAAGAGSAEFEQRFQEL